MNAPQYISKYIKGINYNNKVSVAELQEIISNIMRIDLNWEGSSYENIGRKFRDMRNPKSHLYDSNIREEVISGVKYYWYSVDKIIKLTNSLKQISLLEPKQGTYGAYLNKKCNYDD